VIYLLAGVLAAQTGLIFYLLRTADRDRMQFVAALTTASATPSAEIGALIDLTDRLCQRIQAPTAAVVEHHDKATGPSLPAVNPELDESYWQAQEISKETLAEMAMQQEQRAQAEALA